MAYPAIQVVTLGTDALFSKKKKKQRRSRLKGSANMGRRGAVKNDHLLQNNRIPRKTSPYLGYLRHAPSRSYQHQCQYQYRAAAAARINTKFVGRSSYRQSHPLFDYSPSSPSPSPSSFPLPLSPSSPSSLFPLSSEKFKSSPYVGFMRHAPPTTTAATIQSDFMGFPNSKKNTKRNKENTDANTNTNTNKNTNTDALMLLRYPEYSQYIDGRLPGGNPLHSYYSMWKWIAAEADLNFATDIMNTNQDYSGNANVNINDPSNDPIATIEMFHKVASWFLFPVAYDAETIFYSGGRSSNGGNTNYSGWDGATTTSSSSRNGGNGINHHDPNVEMRRGLEFFSSIIKRFILKKGALMICTGLQMEGNSMIPLPPSSSSSSSSTSTSSTSTSCSPSNHSMTDDNQENRDSHNDCESGKHLDSSSLPPNHPLHISVSSLAKAYHTEQARTAEFLSVYSSEDIAAMSSEEIQRHLDIESILRLPTITYVSPKVKYCSNHNDDCNNSCSRAEARMNKDVSTNAVGPTSGIDMDVDMDTMMLLKEREVKTTSSVQEGTTNSNSNNKNSKKNNALEWSWITVPKDPSSTEDEKDEAKSESDFLIGEEASTVETTMSPNNKESDNNDSNEQHCQEEHCIICLEQFKDGDRLRVLPCNHRFHTGCIDKWLSGSLSYDECFTGLCPTCKKTPNIGILSNSPSFEVGEDDSLGTMGEEMRAEGIVPSWAFARLGGSIAKEK